MSGPNKPTPRETDKFGNLFKIAAIAAVVAAAGFVAAAVEVAAGRAVFVGPVAAAAFPCLDGTSVVGTVVAVFAIPVAVAAVVDVVGRVAAALFGRCRRQHGEARKAG